METDEENRFTSAQEQSSPEIGAGGVFDYESHTLKRTVSETFEPAGTSAISEAAVAIDVDEDGQSAQKCRKSDTTEDQLDSDDGEFNTQVVFALDLSSTVSEEELQKEFDFVKDIANSWRLPPESSTVTLVVYGECAETIPLYRDGNSFCVERTPSKFRRMDLALEEAADNFRGSSTQHQLVVLLTTGRQSSEAESSEDDQELLASASEALSSRNIKVIIVPVGLETDFQELGLIVKRPQSLFPLSSFNDMTPDTATKIASIIKDSIDIEAFAKNKLYTFSGIPQESGLWENISLCSDVMEGAWYLLYDDTKKPNRSETVKKFIRESIDSFHSTLVTESKISISLAVFGRTGDGKSFFLNFLLNWDLPDAHKVKNGPLPSAYGDSKTSLPIHIKYGKDVKVLLHKQEKDASPEEWFSEAALGNNTLERVRNLLNKKFQEGLSLKDERCIELQGPFPVFHYLKEETKTMTSSGHLELEVDVEFIDLPGCGDNTGDESISVELSNADIVLFFDRQQSGRQVTAEDIALIFRRHEEFEFTSRPKLVHIVNDRNPPSNVSSFDFDHLFKKKKKDLNKAWTKFLSGSDYENERAKLPQLNGEALLEKLSNESEVIYFHSENPDILDSLKSVINRHVQQVKIKQTVHPFLQKVHLAAKKLKTRIGNCISTEKRKSKAVEIKEGEVIFKIRPNENEASDLVTSFLAKTSLPLQFDIAGMYHFLYSKFMYSKETQAFLLNMLTESLENFTNKLIYTFTNANWPTVQEAPTDLIEVVEILCKSRVQQFCANNAPAYLVHVLDKGKVKNPFGRAEKKDWSNASPEGKKDQCGKFLRILLDRTYKSLEKETRDKRRKKSHFTLNAQLKQDVKGLLAVRSLDDEASRAGILELLLKKLQNVIKFCNKSIRDINPHPCLDVQAHISLPEKMVAAHEDNTVPVQSSHEEIIKDVIKLLLKPGSRPSKAGADAIRKLEAKLNFGKGGLELRHSQDVDQYLWAKVLITVLCDKDHFNIELDLDLDRHDAEVERLLALSRKRLFSHQKSSITCQIVHDPSLSDSEIHLKKSTEEKSCLEVLVSSKMSDKLDAIREDFKNPSQQLAPIFIPTIRPGPTPDIQGNYFLEEDPWSKDPLLDDRSEEEGEEVGEDAKEEHSQNSSLALNIFLVVEQQHLHTIQTTIERLQRPTANSINLMYIVLPQKGRGIGVTRAIIKSLAECFRFSLYWTIDDDIQFIYQFDGNDRRWHKCALTRGLLFGQRVFQTCLEKTVRELSEEERHELYEDVTCGWPSWAKKTKRIANKLLVDDNLFAEVQKNPSLLHSPFAKMSEDCGEDVNRKEEYKLHVREEEFVEECRKRLFEETVNHIAGISLAHESSKRYDYMSKYPKADYMCSEQRYQVVLHNTPALKGRNFVTDEIIFLDEEYQVYDKDKRNTPYWGIRGSDKSFCHALTVGGVIGYQVIRIVHGHKKLTNVFNRVGPSYIASQSAHGSEDDDDDVDMNDNL